MERICEVCTNTLKRGAERFCSNSCRGKTLKRHGMRGTRQWTIWNHLKQRCDNSKATGYKNYGGRGIRYSDKWRTFEGFWKDMEVGYANNLTIERKDVNGNYSKDNCIWATHKIQSRNKRNSIYLTIGEKRISLISSSETTKIPYNTLYNRIFTYGLTPEQAVSQRSFLHGRIKAKKFLATLLRKV